MTAHNFSASEGRCYECDCRPYGMWSKLPCGTTEADLAAVVASGRAMTRTEAAEVLAADIRFRARIAHLVKRPVIGF